MGSQAAAAGRERRRLRDFRRSARLRLGSLVVDPSTGGRLPGIQGVRGVAAASILLFHVWGLSRFKHGVLYRDVFPQLPVGVTLLFVLSSFLLYRPFAAAVMRGKSCPSIKAYLVNRGLRILPAYWFILVFSALVLETSEVRDAAGHLAVGAIHDPGLLLEDALFLQNFYPSTLLTGIGPAWALTDIVVFYLLLPALALLAFFAAKHAAARRARTLAALAPAALLFLAGMSGKAVAGFVLPGGPWSASWHAVIERSFWGHADFFALGMVVAVLRVQAEDGRLRLPRWWWQPALLVGMAIGISAARFTTPEGFADGSVGNFEYDTLMAVVCAILLSLVVLPASSRPRLVVRLLEHPLLVAVGVVSYSLFLWQVPILVWMRNHGVISGNNGPSADVGGAVLALTVPFLFAVVTYRFIEFPALTRKSRSRRQPAETVLAGGDSVAPKTEPVGPLFR